MKTVIIPVDHLDNEVTLTPFRTYQAMDVVSMVYLPNNDPEDASESELRVKVRVVA